ncbi:MAG: NlpC/P60 family protein [Bacteroides sp.]|nr:NlpC/P60 family protein [Bacteroides sp.]MCM1421926.1 NlpC/P60 family protein [Bacteroides sp.]
MLAVASRLLVLVTVVALTFSCHSSRYSARSVDYRQLARAGLRLGFDIEPKDNWQLLVESASWVGVPYRSGGNDRRGVDCSGLNIAIYNNVYGKKLSRKSLDQKEKDCKRVSRSELRSGDLVFFSTSNSKKKVGHTGIYLKDGKFVHASSSRGVIVSSLDETYYRKHWICGGRVRL